MKEDKQLTEGLSKAQQETLALLAGYRTPMEVTEVIICRSFDYGETGYYVCPKCKISLEREFCAFCDRCGQRLNWQGYKKARRIYAGGAKDYSEWKSCSQAF